MIEVHFLPAQGGDFIWLKYGSTMKQNLIIDSGFSSCKNDFVSVMDWIRKDGGIVEAIILTHTDKDHISGFLNWLRDDPFDPPPVQRIIFNTGRGTERVIKYPPALYPEDGFLAREATGKYSVGQGKTLLEWIDQRGLSPRLIDYTTMTSPPILLDSGAILQFISPSHEELERMAKLWQPEADSPVQYGASEPCYEDLDELMAELSAQDTSISNGASLAFLFEFAGNRLAFLGDAHPDVCLRGLGGLGYSARRPCYADLIKLSHHGSPRNLTQELLRTLPSQHFLLSTSERAPIRPQKVTIARILKCLGKASIYRNCRAGYLLTQADRAKYDQACLALYHMGPGGDRMKTIKEGLILYGKTTNRLRAYEPV